MFPEYFRSGFWMRVLRVAGAVLLFLQATQVSAATVAAYSASAFGTYDLLSVRSAATGQDASGAIDAYFYDSADQFWEAGSADPGGFYRPSGYGAGSRWDDDEGVAVSGQAGSDQMASSQSEAFSTYAFHYMTDQSCTGPGSPSCTDLGPLELIFEYYLEASAEASILGDVQLGWAESSAEVRLACQGDGCSASFPQGTSASASASTRSTGSSFDSVTGTFTLILQYGEQAHLNIQTFPVEGQAEVEILPTPLPAALPMLGGALGALAFAARRRHSATV